MCVKAQHHSMFNVYCRTNLYKIAIIVVCRFLRGTVLFVLGYSAIIYYVQYSLDPTCTLLATPCNAAVLLVLGVLALQRVDTSIIYHMVRGQSILKLYVIFNMLDIFERLLTSVGQDTLDSLYWLAVDRFCGEPGRRRRKRDAVNLVLHFVISNVYVCILFIAKYGNDELYGRSSV